MCDLLLYFYGFFYLIDFVVLFLCLGNTRRNRNSHVVGEIHNACFIFSRSVKICHTIVLGGVALYYLVVDFFS